MKPLPRISFIAAGLLGAAAVPAYYATFGARAKTISEHDTLSGAEASLEAGKLTEAADKAAAAIAINPTDSEPHLLRAWLLLRLADWRGAQVELDVLARLGRSADQLRALRAEAWLLKGEPDTALRELASGAIVDGDKSLALRVPALAKAAKADKAADALFARLIAEYDEDWENWVALARYRLMQGDRGGAIVALDKAMTTEPTAVEVVTLKAMLIRDQYGLNEALPWFDKALALDPRYGQALVEKAATLADLGQTDGAAKALEAAKASVGNEGRIAYVEAVLAARAGKDDIARRALAEVDEATRSSAGGLLISAILDLRSGQPLGAARQLEQILARQPLNSGARALLARAWLDAGDFGRAYRTIAPLAERPDAGSYVLTLAARTLEANGKKAEALPLLARAAQASTASAPAFAAGEQGATSPVDPVRQLVANGNNDAAVERARQIVAKNSGAPQAYVALGDVLVLAGRDMDAAGAFQQAANLRFDEPTAFRLVSALLRSNERDQAGKVTALFIAQNPRSTVMQHIAGSMALTQRKWPQAIAHLESARASGGSNDAALLGDLARAYGGNGETEKALPLARRAYALRPSSAMITHVYAQLLLASGDRSTAPVDLLEKAVALAPQEAGYRKVLDQARRARSS